MASEPVPAPRQGASPRIRPYAAAVKPRHDAQSLIRERGIPAVEAVLLLASASGLSREQLVTSTAPFDAAVIERYHALCERREAGEPIAYLTGWREFYGRAFVVTPDVLIPRPETELLVDCALERLAAIGGSNARVLDLGTGSGVIAISLACERPGLRVTATDISSSALGVARDNARRLGAQVEWIESDWFSAWSGASAMTERFDLIVSNPPYVATGDPHLEEGDLRHEPRHALTDEADGLSAIRRIVHDSRGHLAPGGWLAFEHGYDQAESVATLLAEEGFAEVRSFYDLAGIARVCAGTLR